MIENNQNNNNKNIQNNQNDLYKLFSSIIRHNYNKIQQIGISPGKVDFKKRNRPASLVVTSSTIGNNL